MWETIFVAFAMFSAIPVPHPVWTEKNMRYALCAFPLVGVVIGVAVWGWCALAGWLSLPPLLRGAGVCLLPVVLTGGIHLDGYADTADALASHAPPDKKREILKDPRCGAFAVLRLCCYFVLYFALAVTLEPTREALWPLALAYVLERTLSALAVTTFPLSGTTGLAHTYADGAAKKPVVCFLLVLAGAVMAAMVLRGGWTGGGMALMALWCFFRYRRTADRDFGGVSGDLAGWFLQKTELWMLAVLVLAQCIGDVL